MIFSRITWTFLLSSKSDAFSTLKSFKALVERQFSAKVKIVKSNNAYELGTGEMSKDFFLSQGIIQ